MSSPSSATAGFVHLHTHTEFSKQDGLSKVKALAKRIADEGMPAVAMTDHGNVGGAWKFYQACKAAGVKPILGIEGYMAIAHGPDTYIEVDPPAGSASKAKIQVPAPEMAWDDPGVRFARMLRFEPDAESGKIKRNSNNHITILARNETGWRNLVAINNEAQHSIYNKPLMDYALIKAHAEGLILLSGCLGGPVASRVSMANAALRNVGLMPVVNPDPAAPNGLSVDTQVNPNDPDGSVWRAYDAANRAETEARSNAWKTSKTLLDDDQVAAVRAGATESIVGASDTEQDEARTAFLGYVEDARLALDHLVSCVGAKNVYVEIMEHGLDAEGVNHIRVLTALADAAGVKIVATNDSHYIDCDDHAHHDAWLFAGELARSGSAKTSGGSSKVPDYDDPDRWRFNGSGYHMRTEAEMRALYSGKRWQEACDNTVELAARVDDNVLPIKKLRLPVYQVPQTYVDEWNTGTDVEFTDAEGVVHAAKALNGRTYRTPSYLMMYRLVAEGMKSKYGSMTPELRERLGFEYDVIQLLGLADYFLIVADVIEWARSDRGYPTREYPNGKPGEKKPIEVGPGRGSAAGSAIAYCLDITRVEPLVSGLLFERFLDPERIGMPDIDVDFERDRRDEVYLYVSAKYDRVHVDADGNPVLDERGEVVKDIYVARIGAFQGMKSKRAVLDAGRIHSNPVAARKMADLIPMDGAEPMGFSRIFEEEADRDTGEIIECPQGREFREYLEDNPAAWKILETARAFEGVTAGDGIHAAGVVISDEPLDNLLPMRWQKTKSGDVEMPIVLWDGVDCDKFGLLKLDALGLVNLDYVAACLDNIRLTHGLDLDPYDDIPHPDTKGDEKVDKAFALLRAGRTQSVFQLASSGITDLTTNVAPSTFEDLSAILALYRPGPMGADMHNIYADRKNGRAPVDYSIFTLNPVEQQVITQSLDTTFGTITYQEQLMDLGYRVAGFDAPQRNLLRQAVSKKKKDEVAKAREFFFTQGVQEMVLPDGTVKPAFSRATLDTLWVAFEASAKYLFNKSHTIAYGYLAYLTAYLKANYPTEYTAAVLAVEKQDDRRFALISDARDEGIEVRPPDVNKSGVKTMPDPDDRNVIWFGLGEIRDVKSHAETIVKHRSEGPYLSLHELMQRCTDDAGRFLVPSNSVEGLIESGALDEFGPRMGHMLVARVAAIREVEIPDAEWGALEKSNRQRFRLGFSVGESLLDVYREQVNEFRVGKTVDVSDGFDHSFTARLTVEDAVEDDRHSFGAVIGYLSSWSERITRAGARMANFTLEGRSRRIDGVAFPQAYSSLVATGSKPEVGTIVALTGELKRKESFHGDETGETVEVTELYVKEADNIVVPNAPVYKGFTDAGAFDWSDRFATAATVDVRTERQKKAEEKAAARSGAFSLDPDEPAVDVSRRKTPAPVAVVEREPVDRRVRAVVGYDARNDSLRDWNQFKNWSKDELRAYFHDGRTTAFKEEDSSSLAGTCELRDILDTVIDGDHFDFSLRIESAASPGTFLYLVSTKRARTPIESVECVDLPEDAWQSVLSLGVVPTDYAARISFHKR